ncbi:cytochrome c oxidase assembly protein [Skermanella mucosa]|uniref:cytochrome c oxidase assembly protein n=1 Tax=Skermanella mucosa TaxID=1789672 RepID=UPI00192C35E2|nr:cytochrome c oxidase assembly protein [Skermanella mucosa]UEM21583.1 cytochrome c oxidase assembly protein [Skermanella mucosa]
MTPGKDPRTHGDTRRKNLILMGSLFGLVFGMIGLSFAAVPLYSLFCQVTGFGGTTQRAEGPAGEILDRTVKVRFNADVNGALPWGFQPEIHQMEVRIGESAMTSYRAVNHSDEPIVGTATYNVTPDKAGIYFNKIQCFCFTEQRLEPGQSVDMPVYFFVDPAMADDPKLDDVKTITLSYTFFRAHDGGAAGQVTSINE